jgi:AcrR family transcriptional regulator
MKRPMVSPRRDAILNASIDYILHNGVADLSLRPLAAAVGSKARLLIYHFGTKDALIAEAMIAVRERVQKAFATVVNNTQDRTPFGVMHSFWTWASSPRHERYLRLFFEVHGLALQNPAAYGRYLEGAVSSWIEMFASILPPKIPQARRRIVATIAVSAMAGLLLDYLSSGNKQRTTAALDLFANEFEALLGKQS